MKFLGSNLDAAELELIRGGIHLPQLPQNQFPYQDRPLPENFRYFEQDRLYGDFTRERGDRRDGDPETAARDNLWKEPDRSAVEGREGPDDISLKGDNQQQLSNEFGGGQFGGNQFDGEAFGGTELGGDVSGDMGGE
jgi:hypothetical protein